MNPGSNRAYDQPESHRNQSSQAWTLENQHDGQPDITANPSQQDLAGLAQSQGIPGRVNITASFSHQEGMPLPWSVLDDALESLLEEFPVELLHCEEARAHRTLDELTIVEDNPEKAEDREYELPILTQFMLERSPENPSELAGKAIIRREDHSDLPEHEPLTTVQVGIDLTITIHPMAEQTA